MTAQADIMDQRDPLRGPFVIALTLHAALIAGVLFSKWFESQKDSFGAPDAGGLAIGVETVDSIPLVHHGATNPLTNDTQSEVPQEAVTKPQDRVKEEIPPPDAVPLKTRKLKKLPPQEASERQRFRPINELQPNQLRSTTAPQVSSPAFTALPGSGRVGAGANTLLGTMFPVYASQIQAIITRNWHTGDVDARLRTAPVVIATFDLMRDGSVRNLHITQPSGIAALDSSVQRAILDAHLIPLPQGFNHDHATVEFSFELTR